MAPGAAAAAQTFGFSALAAPTIGREPASAKVSAHDARWGNKPMSRDDLTIYRAQGFGGTVGLGARPGLCIVDFVNGFVDPEIFGGGNIAAAVANTVGLLAAARARHLPVAFSRVVYAADGSDDCAFTRKGPGLAGLTEHSASSQIVPQFSPLPDEPILRKTQPSAFFGTGYAQMLRQRGVDTVIVAGCTTSGCVRATA